MDARIAVAALKAAIRSRAPAKGCIHHSDRGSQYASETYRALLVTHGLTGSMSRRGNPYDNAKAESFMKTLKVEAVYLAAYESFEDVTADLPRFIDEVYTALRARLSQPGAIRGSTRPADGQNRRLILSTCRGALQWGVPFRRRLTRSPPKRDVPFNSLARRSSRGVGSQRGFRSAFLSPKSAEYHGLRITSLGIGTGN